MNKRQGFARLRREFITTAISIRALCRKHSITAHSLVTVQAKKIDWVGKRAACRAKADASFIEKQADHMADRRAEISDKILEAIDEAIAKSRSGLRATKAVRQPDDSITEEPAWYMTPNDLAILIGRFQVLFERPSTISQNLALSTEFTPGALSESIEATRGRGEPSRVEVSPLPRRRRLDD